MSTAPSELLMKKPKAKAEAPDLIVSTVHEIENLSKVEAYERLKLLLNEVDFRSFQLGGILAVAQEK